MPHVVIEEAGDLQGFLSGITPLIQRAGTDILRGILSGRTLSEEWPW